MQFLQAKSADNKLEILDNAPYAIDEIRILNRGIKISLTSPAGKKESIFYESIESLKKEWYVIDCYQDLMDYHTYETQLLERFYHS